MAEVSSGPDAKVLKRLVSPPPVDDDADSRSVAARRARGLFSNNITSADGEPVNQYQNVDIPSSILNGIIHNGIV